MGVGWGVDLVYLIKKVDLMYENGENGGGRRHEELSVKRWGGRRLVCNMGGLVCVCASLPKVAFSFPIS